MYNGIHWLRTTTIMGLGNNMGFKINHEYQIRYVYPYQQLKDWGWGLGWQLKKCCFTFFFLSKKVKIG